MQRHLSIPWPPKWRINRPLCHNNVDKCQLFVLSSASGCVDGVLEKGKLLQRRVHVFWEGTKEGRKEGNVLFNDALNTFYLRLCGVGHMVKEHSDSERGKLAAPTWTALSD